MKGLVLVIGSRDGVGEQRDRDRETDLQGERERRIEGEREEREKGKEEEEEIM